MSASVLFDSPEPRARRRSRVISYIGGIALVAVFVWMLVVMAGPRTTANGTVLPGLFDPSRWDVFENPAVWQSLLVRGLLQGTLFAAIPAAGLALVIGILFSFGRAAHSVWIRVPSTIVLEFFRGMPVLLMMLFILLVFHIGAFWSVIIGLSIYNGAIIGEALRAGIQSLPRGQREAGLSLGLSPLRTRFLIEFPQAFRQMLPIIIAQLVVLLKDTSLGYIVGYAELLRIGINGMVSYYGSGYMFSFFFVVLLIYLPVNLLLSWLARFVARKTGASQRVQQVDASLESE